MEFLWFALIGLAAGWLASQVYRDGAVGLFGTLALGVVGAILGGWLFRLLGFAPTNLFGSLITATVGAALVLWFLRLVRRKR
jgi:uncharacterized membrane protein YeaQ/YmgE (transglycosylase-associated protein family)